ncbi:MAG TPA: aminotransferase class V-fold PLP-dependent enzyme [Thermoanaerobaculaceae bacterium]|nr:aminotransferase class V-fold PLP-dependent enzyme [Thermoanaerobaculaceae bacterium]
MNLPIYMDYNATTPVDPRVLDAMLPCFSDHFGNAASRTHPYGWAAAKLAEGARARIAAAIGAHPEEIVFTSGATEANNLAIKGFAHTVRDHRGHIVTCATEHKAVLDPCAALAREGFSVTVLAVDSDGRLDPQRVAEALTPQTGLVSLMLANNETGTIHPIAAIAALCRERGVVLHCDATQAAGKVPVDVNALGVDLLSLSAHKLYGPKGIGALYVRRRTPRLHLVPILDGGGHEQGMRSGTLNVPGIVGFARALEIALEAIPAESASLAALRDRLQDAICSRLQAVTVNGDAAHRLPNTLNLSFAGVDGAALLVGVREAAVASGSACTSADPKPSHVLLAMGRSKALANASLRFSLGRGNTSKDVETVADAVVREVARLRANSPLWRR